mgnify:CR=1 FL=1
MSVTNGMDLSDPSVGFQWDRFEAGRRYLYLVKPWWSRYGGHFSVVPVSVPPIDNEKFSFVVSTDLSHNLYVDRSFVAEADVAVIAGAVEHALLHHVRDHWRRLTDADAEQWSQWGNAALDLEVNSAIDTSARNYRMEDIHRAALRSTVFSPGDMERWGVDSPPHLPEDALLPRVLEVPDGLSAEKYFDMLTAEEEQPEEEPPPPPEDPDDSDSSDDSEDSDSGSSDEGPTNDSDESGSSDESGDSSSDSGGSGDSDDDSEDSDDTSDDSNEDSSGQSGSGDKDVEDSDSGDDASTADASGDGQDESDSGGDSGDGDADGEDEGSSSASEQSVSQTNAPSSPDALRTRVKDMQSRGMAAAMAGELTNPNDDLTTPSWMPPQLPQGPGEEAISQAEKDLAADIDDHAGELAGEGLEGTTLTQWSREWQHTHGVEWTQVFTRLLSSAASSAKVNGQSDLSYSVRNPNQQDPGVVLMGLHDYAPDIMILVDVSPSMHADTRMNRATGVFVDLCKSVTNEFGADVTWVSADTRIQDVSTTFRWDDSIGERFSVTSGGTSLGKIIVSVMSEGVVLGKRRWPRPDLLVVATDCVFRWPKIRPRTSARLLITDVDSTGRSAMFLPQWINRRTEYVKVRGGAWS